MSLRTFGALAYRELYLSVKRMIPMLIGLVVFSVLAVLVIISYDCGNLRVLIDKLSTAADGVSVPKDELAKIIAKENVVLASKAYPILLSGFSAVSFLEACIYDEKGKWNYFYMSTPVTPAAKSAVTYLVVIAINVVSLLVGMLFCLIIGIISGIPVSLVDLGLLLAGIAAGDLLGMLLQIGIKLFHSLDKAGIMLFIFLIAAFILFATNNIVDSYGKPTESTGSLFDMSIISGFAEKALIIAPVVIIASAVIGFSANVMIYKRGEK